MPEKQPPRPHSLTEITGALRESARDVETFFAELPLEDFYCHLPNAWAPVDDLRHLSRSSSPLAQALKMPKLVLRSMFGRGGESRTYEDVFAQYLAALDDGTAVATGRYIPSDREGQKEDETYRAGTLERWRQINDDLQKALGRWKESQLDSYRLPHPVLGKLTVREMLFFTHFHNQTHIDIAQKRIAQVRGQIPTEKTRENVSRAS